MTWINCDLQPHGRRVPRGPFNNPELWRTFCPKLKFPRDRILVSKCKGCNHFKGITYRDGQQPTKPLNIQRIKRGAFIDREITMEMIMQATKEIEEAERRWAEEEEQLVGF